MTEAFLSSEPAISTRSALFVAWGQLLTFDIYLNVDNSSDPFDVPCDDGGGVVDVWCPQGEASDDISFFRSEAAVDEDGDDVRSPINYATAYVDLDFIYGRSEAEAAALRTLEGGLMNVTETGVPFQNADGTWLVNKQVFCFLFFVFMSTKRVFGFWALALSRPLLRSSRLAGAIGLGRRHMAGNKQRLFFVMSTNETRSFGPCRGPLLRSSRLCWSYTSRPIDRPWSVQFVGL